MRPGAWRRLAPTLAAGLLGLVYVIVSPPTRDLAAHLLRAKLFDAEGFGIWSNWWYAGHDVPGYSVLFGALAAALTPQLAAALAAVGSAALFETLARAHFGRDAWLGALWFGAGTATNLFTGRLTFAFGLLPALAAALALQRGRPRIALGLGALTALCSPVAALFAALAGAAYAVGSLGAHKHHRILAGLSLALAALAPILALAIVFPEGGREPFTFATLWPITLIAVIAIRAIPHRDRTLRAGVALYALGCVAAFGLSTPIGSNAARLGALVAGPLAALLWWRRRVVLLLATALALLYVQWQAPVADVRALAGDPSVTAGYYRPLLGFLARQAGPPFRIEIPFTQSHWEAYRVAPRFPLARGWERQLDIADNRLFYDEPLTAATYDAWLHRLAVRFVAVSDAALDYSAQRENALIAGGLPYLRLVAHPRHWRIYAVAEATPIVQGAATLRALGPNSLTLHARRPGIALVRVRFSPYWALAGGPGCVAPWGDFTKLTLRRAGPLRLVIRFSAGRIGARSPRCAAR
ncbi:MAG: hypothetical protein ACR2IP_05415 [Solirubrobacteraceae bacterium]